MIAPHESHAGASSWLFRIAAFSPAIDEVPTTTPTTTPITPPITGPESDDDPPATPRVSAAADGRGEASGCPLEPGRDDRVVAGAEWPLPLDGALFVLAGEDAFHALLSSVTNLSNLSNLSD